MRRYYSLPLAGVLGMLFAIGSANATGRPQLYVHAGGGFAAAILEASDVDETLENDFTHANLGFFPGLQVRGGIRNILQVEFRQFFASHTLVKPGFVNKSNRDFGVLDDVGMKYRSGELLLKFNPFFAKGTSGKEYRGWFLVGGVGNVTYESKKTKDGFKGNGTVFGVEYFIITKRASIGISFTRHGLQFDEGTLISVQRPLQRTNRPLTEKLDAAHYAVYFSLAAGVGL